MKRIAILLAVVLALLVGAYWSLRDGARGETSLEPAPEPRPHLEAQAAPIVPVELVTPNDRAAVPNVVEEKAGAAPTPASAARSESERTLSGTIVVLDEQGVEHPSENGNFHFILWKGDHGNWHEVEVALGRWTTTIPEESWPEKIGVDRIELGQRRTVPVDADSDLRWTPGDPGLRNLRVRWPAASRLFVRDRVTGAELDDVRVVAAPEWPSSDLAHPGAAASRAANYGRSPFTLRAPELSDDRSQILFATSPGHAWGRIEIDADRGGDRILPLEPGGDLDVQIVGAVADPKLVLRLYREEGRPVVEFGIPREHKSVEILGLVPGEYRVVAQIGDWWAKPIELGTDKATVVAGQRSRAVIVLQGLAASARVPLSGMLVIPAAWNLDDFSLDFELQGTALGGGESRFAISRAKMQSSGDGVTYRWKAPEVQVGKYEAEISELAFSVVIDVVAPGTEDARIEVPPPAAVTVRCVDAASGAEVEGANVDWRCKVPEGVGGWSSKHTEWDAERGCFVFRAPIGMVLLSGNQSGYAWTSKEFEVVAGDNALVLRMAQQCSLRPILRDGETVIPLGSGSKFGLVGLENQVGYDSRSWSNGVLTLHRIDPGLYTLKFPPIPGFEPVPDATVRLETGRVVEHVVQLVRTH